MEATDARQLLAELALSRILREFDARCLYFDVKTHFRGNRILAKGVVHYPQLAAAAEHALQAQFPDHEVRREIKVLTSDWPVRFGEVIPPSVMGMLRPDGEPRDATTELLAGQFVRMFWRKGNWTLCQAPDGYISWVPKETLRPAPQDKYVQWAQGKRWRLLSPWNDGESNEYRIGSEFRLLRPGHVHVPALGLTPIPTEGEVVDPARNPLRERVVEVGRSFLGVPYLWGGRTDRGLDCSGFCQVVYARVGVAIPRDANQQANLGILVGHLPDYRDVAAGDLIFFMNSKTAKIYHVGISLGGSAFIHSESKCGVTEACLEGSEESPGHPYASHFCFARRILV